jgi:subtilisin family serine protease
MRVLIQLRPVPVFAAESADAATTARSAAAAPSMASLGAEALGGLSAAFSLDATYEPVPVPTPVAEEAGADRFSFSAPRHFVTRPEASTHVVRGTIPDGVRQQTALAELTAHPDVVGVFADPVIESMLVCPGDAAVGTDTDVQAQLGVSNLASNGMDGDGVTVAIVDSGVNVAYLQSKGHNPKFSAPKSWTPAGVTSTPGKHPVAHGTMCAYDVGLSAPKATLVDYAILLSTTRGANRMAGLLSDAVLAYSKLLQLAGSMPAARRALVVTNSWGMFSPTWDFPVGHPGNYSDNPAHPFNVIVASLEAAGADVLFAAGNCGRDCPDGRCDFLGARSICGANSHPSVISVAGVDVKRRRVGYSSQGPGRLARQKPDLSCYTHFKGSEVKGPDSGTSAACPVLAGFVAAVRSKHPASRISPAQLRSLLIKTAVDLGSTGFDFDFGWGVPDAQALVPALGAADGAAPGASTSRRRRRAGRKKS